MNRSQLSAFLLGLLLLFSRDFRAAAAEASARATALSSITAAEAHEVVAALADDTFEGREAGSRGNRAASQYIVERLKKVGLTPAGSKASFIQSGNGCNNILATLEGSDPELKQQVVLIGAHFDHVGYGNNRNSYGPVGYIHNGADDNASGVAGLLEIAHAMSLLPEAPRRTILFAFWDGEEKGLIGSQYWANQPTIPLSRVVLAMNIDMIGRLRSRLDVYGTRSSWGLRGLISSQNADTQIPLNFTWEMKPDSDHHTFYSREIPVIMVHSGMHEDYHRPSDDVQKINSEGLQQVSRMLFGVLLELADAPSLRGFRRQGRQETKYDQQTVERPLVPPPGRLGIRVDGRAATNGQVVVSGVTPGSPGDKAGLRTGDRIVRFADRDVTDPDQFLATVWAATAPAQATIARPGVEEPLEVSIELAGKPTRLGISWRTDDAEPATVIISRLTPGAAADRAGIRVNDRISRVNGQPFATSEEFRQLATREAIGALTFEVESQGRPRTVEIQVPE